MKKQLALILAVFLVLSGCSAPTAAESTPPVTEPPVSTFSGTMPDTSTDVPFTSRFDSETVIVLSDSGITVDGGGETDTVFTSHDVIYYEDRETYESGYPYGAGEVRDRHSAQEAARHTVINITDPGTYRLSGTLSAGQIRIDLGEEAFGNPEAVVELILDNADITCTVAPAILFLNVYECNGNWSTETAKADVDTSAAGSNLILEGENTVSGSYVAKIYKDKEGEKKLWKQDGAIYSYMSMNVFGPGSLRLNASNEGLDSELHLTINGGDISIRSGNDGINTNEDGVSVTTINGGSLHIVAGLGEEGDGIDSNGYLVINGGTVVSSAHPAADAGLDSDLGSFIHGGTVIALGSTMDWAENDSRQVTMNLQFAGYQSSGSAIVVARSDGTVLFAYDPSEDEILGNDTRNYMGAVLSCPGLTQGETVLVYLNGTLTGTETGGMYSQVTAYESGVQMAYTGSDLGGFGGMGFPGGFGGELPEGMEPPQGFGGEMPEGMEPPQGSGGEMPEGMEPPQGFGGRMPEGMEPPQGFGGGMPEGMELPQGFGGEMPEGMEPPQGETPELPQGNFGGGNRGQNGQTSGEASAAFFLADQVNAFSGVRAVN